MRSENQKIKQRLEIINKRIGFLKTRVSENPTRDMSYDKHEFTALEWMLKSNEELRGKLKIAHEALARIRDKAEDNLIAAIADDVLNPKVVIFSDEINTLKQIRGE